MNGVEPGSYPPHYAYPSAPPIYRVLPDPVRLHWGWVLALQIVTLGLFGSVWMFVQANWARKVLLQKKAFAWTLTYMLYLPAMIVLGVVLGIVLIILHVDPSQAGGPIELLARVLGIVLYCGAAFTLKGELETAPIGLSLSGVMTFLFAPIYFQYHLQDFTYESSASAQSGLGLTTPARAGLVPLNSNEPPAA